MTKIVIEVTNTTPMLVGWHDPELVDPMGLRATEVKGIWRWWARAVVAGALYDKNMLIGERGEDAVRRPLPNEIHAINCLVGKVMGLGYTGEREAEQARLHLYVEKVGVLEPRVVTGDGLGYQRLRLLSLGRKRHQYIDTGSRFRIEVDIVRREYADAEDLALKILVLSLQLMGIGKGSRKGLGSLDVTYTNLSIPSSLADLVEEIYRGVSHLVDKYGYSECKAQQKSVRKGLPPIPALSRDQYNRFNIAQIHVVRNVDLGKFIEIHNFFVRSERCRKLYGNPVCEDKLRKSLHAWVLGLPRSQRGTGYSSEDFERRASPMFISYHEKGNRLGQGVFVTMLASGDWPRKIEWAGAGSQMLVIDEGDVVNAMANALNEFREYVDKLKLQMNRVWPW
ncbi:hypothetical protein QPL79_09115 [Ignisphaera sp. 4213-co]|uniref:CRISPR type III-associated protein domain-containing protein n=1 Tax=Ignisphaera cupida TaxID=3050454 RepID=A0ABD4Z9C7_9CREN|nr:RAMP superfamily CRISPR-associated protein [Ignisphaera sp. 4213-co]MDK6029522.1 hypothetical protein [Ignisphaera sp. 4213-co]